MPLIDDKVFRLVRERGPVSAALLVSAVWPARLKRRHSARDVQALRCEVLGCLGRLQVRGLVAPEPAGRKGSVVWRTVPPAPDGYARAA